MIPILDQQGFVTKDAIRIWYDIDVPEPDPVLLKRRQRCDEFPTPDGWEDAQVTQVINGVERTVKNPAGRLLPFIPSRLPDYKRNGEDHLRTVRECRSQLGVLVKVRFCLAEVLEHSSIRRLHPPIRPPGCGRLSLCDYFLPHRA